MAKRQWRLSENANTLACNANTARTSVSRRNSYSFFFSVKDTAAVSRL